MPLRSPSAPSRPPSSRARFASLVVAGLTLWIGAAPVQARQTQPGSPAGVREVSLSDATLLELNQALDAGTLTSERLVELFLARIAAYDAAGPTLNSVIWINEEALETARALDAERRERGPRSPLHGIPVALKDNLDTRDMPTTAGSVFLDGSIPTRDAFLVEKMREAGAIILTKLNMSEFASGAVLSSLGGPMRNPHDLVRTPSGSSGGTGINLAAWMAQVGIGTDTGGSVRGPSTSNGIVGLKPTLGLLSRSGIVPLALTFDTAGPMSRSVYDLAVFLGVLTGVDPRDPETSRSQGRAETDYTRHLDANSLRGARIGLARDFLGQDPEVDWVIDAAVAQMREAGATVVDIRFPQWFLDAKGEWYNAIRRPEFKIQIADYLAGLAPGYPRTLSEMIALSQAQPSPARADIVTNPVRWSLFLQEEASGDLTQASYLSIRDQALPLARAIVEGILAENTLDAIIYPTSPVRPALLSGGGGAVVSATNIANLTGFPDLIVPAGFTGDGLPVGISFFGPAFSEARLLGLGYAFEQRTRARRNPVHTPPLPGERIQLP